MSVTPAALSDLSGGELALAKLWSGYCPSKGRFFIAFPKYLALNNNCSCLDRIMSSPMVLKNTWCWNCSNLQHPVLTLLFFLQDVFGEECPWSHCRKGMEMSLPAYRSKWAEWECDPQKLLPSSLQWFSWRRFGCRGISMLFLFDKNRRKSVCWFYWNVILKHSCISVAHQLKWKSMARSPNYGGAGSFPVCSPLLICTFAHRSWVSDRNCVERVW